MRNIAKDPGEWAKLIFETSFVMLASEAEMSAMSVVAGDSHAPVPERLEYTYGNMTIIEENSTAGEMNAYLAGRPFVEDMDEEAEARIMTPTKRSLTINQAVELYDIAQVVSYINPEDLIAAHEILEGYHYASIQDPGFFANFRRPSEEDMGKLERFSTALSEVAERLIAFRDPTGMVGWGDLLTDMSFLRVDQNLDAINAISSADALQRERERALKGRLTISADPFDRLMRGY